MSISQVSAHPSLRATMAVAALRNAPAPSAASPPAATRQPDAVNLSDAARALSAASKSVSNASDMRADRIAALKASIANGTYTVSSQDLARSLLRAASI